MTDMALSRLLTQLEIAGVPHGFRSSFRDWTAEETNHPREVVEAAYARSDPFGDTSATRMVERNCAKSGALSRDSPFGRCRNRCHA